MEKNYKKSLWVSERLGVTMKNLDARQLAKNDLFLKGTKHFIDSSHNKTAHVSLFKHKRPTHEFTKFWYGKQPWLKDRIW